ncbi:MAG TPA: tectonin domain-containing protein [Longimicrobium sp.]|nr:tectonin domain-containing protein [Longimicrobium sp.]
MSSIETEITTTTANAPAAPPETLAVAGLTVAPAVPAVPAWHSVPGTLTQVSVGGVGHIWGVNAEHTVFQRQNAGWSRPVPEQPLVSVSVGADGTVWGVNKVGENGYENFRRDGDIWTPIDGKLKQISVGSAEHVWGVDDKGQIRERFEDGWRIINGPQLASVSVGADGTVWGVKTGGVVMRRDGHNWSSVDSALLTQVSVGSATQVWGVDGKGKIWTWDGNTRTLKEVTTTGTGTGTFTNISAASDGTVWGLKKTLDPNSIYYRLNAAPLVIYNSGLTEVDLEAGEHADFGFSFTNLVPGVTLSEITATLLYDKEAYSASGMTVTPDSKTFEGSLGTNASGYLEFRLTAADNARLGKYGFYGVDVTYTVTPVIATPVFSDRGGSMHFKVVSPHAIP